MPIYAALLVYADNIYTRTLAFVRVVCLSNNEVLKHPLFAFDSLTFCIIMVTLFLFLVHLSRRLKCTIVIMRCPSSVRRPSVRRPSVRR